MLQDPLNQQAVSIRLLSSWPAWLASQVARRFCARRANAGLLIGCRSEAAHGDYYIYIGARAAPCRKQLAASDRDDSHPSFQREGSNSPP